MAVVPDAVEAADIVDVPVAAAPVEVAANCYKLNYLIWKSDYHKQSGTVLAVAVVARVAENFLGNETAFCF